MKLVKGEVLSLQQINISTFLIVALILVTTKSIAEFTGIISNVLTLKSLTDQNSATFDKPLRWRTKEVIKD